MEELVSTRGSDFKTNTNAATTGETTTTEREEEKAASIAL